MTSRLERLFLLLETGQSNFLRKSAAYQIGEIVKTHPNELGQLLEKLKPLVVNTSWDTRIAASLTIESIMKNLNDLDLITHFFSQATNTNEPTPSTSSSAIEQTLDNFNLIHILKTNGMLLSSDTQKYDAKDAENLSQQQTAALNEKIKQQRNLLNLKLGIDVGGAAKLDTSHIFTDYDIMSSAADLDAHVDESTHKRKLTAESTAASLSRSESTESTKKIKMEPDLDTDSSSSSSSDDLTAPFSYIKHLDQFTKWIFNRTFNPEWEVRHGSATCLREIVKKLVSGLLANKNLLLIENFLHWFEVCLYRLFKVIALDRFADYIGDEVVAPVRETCTQIIGIISKLYTNNAANINRLCTTINAFLTHVSDEGGNKWEISHSGIMILKYTIAAASTNDLAYLRQILLLTFPNIIKCIQDNDDDVRQVASSTLEPVSKHLNEILPPDQLQNLIRILIDVLSDLDDLGTSCSNIMSLLSDLLSLDTNQQTFISLLNNQSILPRLLPFMNHSSLTVKQTTLNTINKIILAINGQSPFRFESLERAENLITLFRLLYQQAILLNGDQAFKTLEPNLLELWHTLCYNLSPRTLIQVCFPYITTWLMLFMHPANQQIECNYLVNLKDASKEYLGSNLIRFEDKLTRDRIQIKCRLVAANMLAILFNRISQIDPDYPDGRPFEQIIQFLSTQINFKSGLQRFCFSLLVVYLIEAALRSGNTHAYESLKKSLSNKIISCLDDENTIYFDEIGVLFTRLQKEIRYLLTNYQRYLTVNLGVNLTDHANKNVFTFDDITNLTGLIQDKLNTITDVPKNETKLNADLKLLLSNLIETNRQTFSEQEQLQIRSLFALASACIQLNTLCERMNPLVRPLIECIRFEPNGDLQQLSSKHLALLLQTCAKRQPNPIPKIFKNLLSYLCNDPARTPVLQNQSDIKMLPDKEYYEVNRYYGILSDNLGCAAEPTVEPAQTPLTPNTPNKQKKKLNGQGEPQSNGGGLTPSGGPQTDQYKHQIEKRGAELAFKSIIELYNGLEKLESIVPDLIHQPLGQITTVLSIQGGSNSDELSLISELNLDANMGKYQELVNNLCLVEYVCSLDNLDGQILEKYLQVTPDLIKLIKLPVTAVRHLTSRCLAMICRQDLVKTMQLILEYALDCLDNNEFNLFSRQGAIELIYCLFEQLSNQIIPFIVIFIVPILKRMCDLDWYVRSMASQCFGTLVKLYPLSSSNLPIMTNSLDEITRTNPNILRMKLEQQDFLDQLMDNRKLKAYDLPTDVLINVQLRPYQQMGVNWLAFLKKFNLHGILCDDMGLGKTLQSICILAGDHNERLAHSSSSCHVQDDDDDSKFTPSIIICPTTLTNHWYHEIERFVDRKCLRPFIYAGTISEREGLRRSFFHPDKGKKSNAATRPNVFICSYDIIRHDVQYIGMQKWNYCILDEGHLIKSSKSKLSKSIKQLRASHRLILTGTPIQNNVTELWCLFDFLLPGYLGTEKQFQFKYARYIAPQSASFQHKLERSMSQQQQNNDSTKVKSQSSANSSDTTGFHQLSVIALESLHKQVLPFLLRRTKEEVLNDLPPKIIQDYYCEMSQLQIELYQDFAKSNVSDNIKKSLGLFDQEEPPEDEEPQEEKKMDKKNSEHVFQALQYLRKVVNHPSLVLKTDHPKWNKLKNDFNLSQSSLNDIKYSGKLLALRDLLMECGIGGTAGLNDDAALGHSTTSLNEYEQETGVLNQHRVLIFCQLKSMIDIIENELLRKMKNTTFLRLDGTIPPGERFNIVKKFNSDPSIDILLLTTQIGGLGLNLTGADTVIFVEHDWNPQKDLQAMDRAHRIGQTKVVNVYRLITKRTIEEKIMSLQKFKLGIANSVVNIENSSLTSMGTEQLMNMFNRETTAPSSNNTSTTTSSGGGDVTAAAASSGYQRILDNINEIWDETQYENEYNLDNFIKSLN